MDKKLLLGILIGAISVPLIVGAVVTTAQIADNAITSRKIATGAVGGSDIANSAVTKYKIATGAVTGSRIANGAISKDDLNTDLRTLPDYTLTITKDIDLPSLNAQDCYNALTVLIDVPGAQVGDQVIASPEAVTNGIETDLETIWNPYVHSEDHVLLRLCNLGDATIDFASQTWTISVMHY